MRCVASALHCTVTATAIATATATATATAAATTTTLTVAPTADRTTCRITPTIEASVPVPGLVLVGVVVRREVQVGLIQAHSPGAVGGRCRSEGMVAVCVCVCVYLCMCVCVCLCVCMCV